MWNVLDRAIECAPRRKRADVELVQDRPRQRPATPRRIGPRKGAVVDQLREPEHPDGLRRRARIPPRLTAVERETVAGSCLRVRVRRLPPTDFDLGHRRPTAAGDDVDPPSVRRPHGEPVHYGSRPWTATGNCATSL